MSAQGVIGDHPGRKGAAAMGQRRVLCLVGVNEGFGGFAVAAGPTCEKVADFCHFYVMSVILP
ncbi:MAG: hypothetical protein EP347_09940 [Alphaproteobacteria bacterium]|nr:MAG: hypothetical protein EP347_09940 [Alphaproteobacteria bacterium]